MRFLLFISFSIFVGYLSFAQQHTGKVWTEVGLQGKIYKDLSYGLDINTRFGNYGLETFFPQVSFKYKVTKWFRPSIDFRVIGDRKYFDERFSFSERLNLNAEFRHEIKRWSLKARLRYQIAFDNVRDNYDAEFDQAARLKLEGKYDIDKFFLSPTVSAEVFVSPFYSPEISNFNKYRVFVGVDSDFKGPHSFSLGYIFDAKMDLPFNKFRHICSVSYSYEIEPKEKSNGGDKL